MNSPSWLSRRDWWRAFWLGLGGAAAYLVLEFGGGCVEDSSLTGGRVSENEISETRIQGVYRLMIVG